MHHLDSVDLPTRISHDQIKSNLNMSPKLVKLKVVGKVGKVNEFKFEFFEKYSFTSPLSNNFHNIVEKRHRQFDSYLAIIIPRILIEYLIILNRTCLSVLLIVNKTLTFRYK